MNNTGYLAFFATSNTLFTYVDADGQSHEMQFDPTDPQAAIDVISTIIQQQGLTHVGCNYMGYGLCGCIAHQLRTKYGNTHCEFTLN